MKRIHIFTTTALVAFVTIARADTITLDGQFDDWTATSVVASDGAGDDGPSGIDFGDVAFTNDDRYVYFRFETGAEVQGDEQQDIRLYLDTDMDAGTGTSFGGIGADLVWNFGDRRGTFRGSQIFHDDVGLLLGPTVSNTEFEIALRLDAQPSGPNPLFPGTQVRWILLDAASNGDRIPNAGSVTSTIREAAPNDPSVPLAKDDAAHLRITAFNVLSDGLFDGGSRQAAYTRVLNAIDADVWVFNEVWDNDANDVENRLDALVPTAGGWNAVKRDSGNVIASRAPILDSWDVFPGSRLTAARIDLERDVLVIAAHLSCCTADAQRQDQADALVAFLRDARTPGGAIDLPADTPIVAAGDFNLVGWRRQLDTILTGDIFDEGQFGPDSPPDWDGSGFDLPASTHNDQRVGFTWRNDGSSFYPGLLDFTFVTGSVVGIGNHYIFDTRTMRSSTLSANGLQAGDSFSVSDHNPRVLDLVLETSTDAPSRASRLRLEAAPNPFNPRTEIRFTLPAADDAELVVYDVEGRRVRTLAAGPLPAGPHRVEWNGSDAQGRAVASGVYLVRLRVGDEVISRKVSLVE